MRISRSQQQQQQDFETHCSQAEKICIDDFGGPLLSNGTPASHSNDHVFEVLVEGGYWCRFKQQDGNIDSEIIRREKWVRWCPAVEESVLNNE